MTTLNLLKALDNGNLVSPVSISMVLELMGKVFKCDKTVMKYIEQAYKIKENKHLMVTCDIFGFESTEEYDVDFEYGIDIRKSAKIINKYVKKYTKGMIPKLLDFEPEGDDVIIVSTLYFKCDWLNKFKKENTRKKVEFKGENGKTKIDMLCMNDKFEFMKTKNLKSVIIPYQDERFIMILSQPIDIEIDIKDCVNKELLKHLSPNNFEQKSVDLMIPKMKIESTYDNMLNILENSGLDLVEINKKVTLTRVIHKVIIESDEDGTVVVAATAGRMKCMMAPRKKVEIEEWHGDHPYILTILDNFNKSIILLGIVDLTKQ